MTVPRVLAAAALSLILSGCGQPEQPIGPPTLDVGVASPGNGTVTIDLTPSGVIVRIMDPDGIGNFQITATIGGGSTFEQGGNGVCATTVTVRLTPRASHNHPHRVTWTDCQGRQPGETSGTEVWDFTSDSTPPSRTTSQLDRSPKLVDASGRTRFHAVIVGHSFGGDRLPCANRVTDLTRRLRQYPGWGRLPDAITDAQATRDSVTRAVEAAKQRAQPGDEFLFYFCDHGFNNAPDQNGDEPDGADGGLSFAPGRPTDRMTDDELTTLLSGFRRSVTMTVALDVCHAGDFVAGTSDLLNTVDRPRRPDRPSQRLDKDHLAILMASCPTEPALNAEFTAAVVNCLNEDGRSNRSVADINQDGITTADELFNCARRAVQRSTPVFARGTGP